MAGLRPASLPPPASLPDVNLRVGYVIKDWFFNTDNVRKHVRDSERTVLNRYGATVRKVARHSMKYRAPERKGKKGYASAPGTPPHAHARGRGDTGGLKYGPFNILYGYDPVRRSVVIGPRKKPNTGNIPSALEYGASLGNVRNTRRRKRRVGGRGIVKAEKGNRSLSGRGKRRVTGRDGETYTVTYATLKTQDMLERSNDLETMIWGPETLSSVAIAPRPYMRPAAAVVDQMLPRFWAEAQANSTYFTGLE